MQRKPQLLQVVATLHPSCGFSCGVDGLDEHGVGTVAVVKAGRVDVKGNPGTLSAKPIETAEKLGYRKKLGSGLTRAAGYSSRWLTICYNGIMLVIPAIDIRNGKCVRLQQGDYNQETIYGDSPVERAFQWEQQGAQFLHVVDLDGAKTGQPTNFFLVREIVQSIKIPIELGGGIRSQETIQRYLDAGVHRLVVGTLALKDPGWFRVMSQQFPHRLVLGIDGRDGFVAAEGWLETSQMPAANLAQKYVDLPLAALVYTDIAKDGMLAGPNIEEMETMRRAVPFPLVVSGGIASLDDIRRLAQCNFHACIIGKALYENKFRLCEALDAVV